MANNKKKILHVKDLKTYFFTENGIVKAVDGVDFEVYQGETLGLVGESGCGKSVTAFSIVRLLDYPGKIVNGQVLFKGEDLLGKNEKQMRQIRGKAISMIFQEPMTSLNPVFTIGFQISEALEVHYRISKKEARQRAIQLLEKVGIPIPEQRIDEYPHQLSGGMRQRAMIAMALACDPALLIADEPTTALDVIVEAQFLDLLNVLRQQFDLTILLITHNLGIVAQLADRVTVMYAGMIAETGDVGALFANPLHPYTQGLLASIPNIKLEQPKLVTMPGQTPDLVNPPPGCRFHPRCPQRLGICSQKMPPMFSQNGSQAACWLYQGN